MECSCDKCAGACSDKPGWFMPGQAERAAELLGFSLAEFFSKYLGVDWWEGDGQISDDDIFLLAPAITGMSAGSEYPASPRGRCVFLKDSLCLIHAAKPFECAEFMHGDSSEAIAARHKSVAQAWNEAEHQNQVRSLLGRDPYTAECGMMDMLGVFGW